MTNPKLILLIGRSGRGKSALANVVTSTDKFKESSGSASETKKIQLEQFEDINNKTNYAIIDTPGIGDTKMSEDEVLDIIAEAVYLARDGIGQVFFVINGRFDKYEMATYDLLRTILFDKDITKNTTVIRTNFKEFRQPDKCKDDINVMVKEAKEKRVELSQNIATKEKEIENLTPASEQHQKLLKEIEQLKKELETTNLAEIIESCQKKIIYVDNPSLKLEAPDDEDEEEREWREKQIKKRQKSRGESREILLSHLNESCQRDLYRPEKLAQLSNDIVDDYFDYLKKKEELQREVERLKSKKSEVNVNQISMVKISESDTYSKVGQAKVREQKSSLVEAKDKLEIVDFKELLSRLQDKKERLKKEIAEKEKAIRQKVLKHIFNNYEGISQELGGDVFLNSVTGDHNWPKINPGFANKELIVKWLSQGFDYQQTKDWALALKSDFIPKNDAGFCAWLRDTKKLTVEKVKNSKFNIEQLRQEYAQQLKGEVNLLDKHNEQLKNWKEIHLDFAIKSYGKTYQQYWEEQGLTYQDAQAWIPVGFKPEDYEKVKQWKNLSFTPSQVQSLIKQGFQLDDCWLIPAYAHGKGYQLTNLNWLAIQKDYQTWKENLTLQEFLNIKYPTPPEKESVKEIIIGYASPKSTIPKEQSKLLQGNQLNLSEYPNLEEVRINGNCLKSKLIELNLGSCARLVELSCFFNQLTKLDLSDGINLERLDCSYNRLTNLNFVNNLNSEGLTVLSISNNSIAGDLDSLQKLVNLRELYLGDNPLYGSLEPLKGMVRLEWLNIADTNLDSGLEYLPESIEYFNCSVDKKDAKCQTLNNLLKNTPGENFPQKLQEYKQKLQEQSQQSAQIQVPPKS